MVQTLHLAAWANPSESERSRTYASRAQETLDESWEPKDIDEVLGVVERALVSMGNLDQPCYN